jgi:hypothetical protein
LVDKGEKKVSSTVGHDLMHPTLEGDLLARNLDIDFITFLSGI